MCYVTDALLSNSRPITVAVKMPPQMVTSHARVAIASPKLNSARLTLCLKKKTSKQN